MFGDVPHQICEFHIIKELTKAILRAVAKVRKKLAARKPTWQAWPAYHVSGQASRAPAANDCNRKSRICSSIAISSSSTI